jgi:hypothetical protein
MPDIFIGMFYMFVWAVVFACVGFVGLAIRRWSEADFRMPWSKPQVSVANGAGIGNHSTVSSDAPQNAPTRSLVPDLVDIHTIAQADNILIVGNKDSGKTTLLQSLIGLRQGLHCVFDPHNAPNKWVSSNQVVGGGLDYEAIAHGLQNEYQRMHTRAQEMSKQGNSAWQEVTLVADEWRAITQELDGKQGRFNAADVLLKILTQGRKFDMRFLAASHNDTTASLGVAGDKEVVFSSFDWIIYTGAFVRKKLITELWERLPTTTTPDGKLLPLVVVAYNPVEEQMYLLDIRNLPQPTKPPQAEKKVDALLNQLYEEWEPSNGSTVGSAGSPVMPVQDQVVLTPKHLRVLQLLMTDPSMSIRAVARDLWPQSGDGGSGYSEMAKKMMREVVEITGVKCEALEKINGVKVHSNGVKQV